MKKMDSRTPTSQVETTEKHFGKMRSRNSEKKDKLLFQIYKYALFEHILFSRMGLGVLHKTYEAVNLNRQVVDTQVPRIPCQPHYQ